MNARIAIWMACSVLLGQDVKGPVDHPAKSGLRGGSPDSVSLFPTRHPRYQVRPGDIIELSFSPTPEYNQTVAVHPDGYVTLREVGDIYVGGATVPELRNLISTGYEKILHEPEITVTLKEFDKPHFTVTGQVGHPGRFELRSDTTVSEALAVAGGTTEKSKDSQVLLFRRISDDWVEAKLLDVKALYKGRIEEDVHLRPGDMIVVPQNRMSKIKPFLPVWAISTYMNPGAF